MKLIEDLGMQYPTKNSKEKRRFGTYECPVCGKHFRCLMMAIKSGNTTKCADCGFKTAALHRVQAASDRFVEKVSSIHDNKYSYVLLDYVSSHRKIQIICPVHGIFWQEPSEHLRGHGCPECAKGINNITLRMTVSSGKPTTLYYIYLPEHNLWKVGCTERSIEDRFRDDKTPIEILGIKTYEDSREAYFVEAWILRATSINKSTLKPLKSGNSEVRSEPIINILNLVKEAEVFLSNKEPNYTE